MEILKVLKNFLATNVSTDIPMYVLNVNGIGMANMIPIVVWR